MKLIYDAEKLNSILNDFYIVTGINVDFLDSDRKLLYKKGKNTHNPYCRAVRSSKNGRMGCSASDQILLDACDKSRHVEVHECHAGLIDAAVPIIYNGFIAGYIIIGAMRHALDFDAIRKYLEKYPLHNDKMSRYYSLLPLYDEKTITSIANITEMLAKYVIVESMLQFSDTANFGAVLDYIDNDLLNLRTYQDIVSNTHISKSTLYREMKRNFDCTPGEYILGKKIEYAKVLLSDEKLSVNDISQKLGFSTQSYFGRIFREKTGLSPTAYKKRRKNQ